MRTQIYFTICADIFFIGPLTSATTVQVLSPSHDILSHKAPVSRRLLVKVRLCEIDAEDFVEVEVPYLTYRSLLTSVCEELELSSFDVAKIRKLPNVLVRKDKDVLRLREGQELEVVLNSSRVRNQDSHIVNIIQNDHLSTAGPSTHMSTAHYMPHN